MIRILIADDHAILRQGLKTILAETKEILVCDEAASGEEVLEKVNASDFDVIVLDISMPEGNGINTLQVLRKQGIKIPILILSMHEEDQYALCSIRAGADGYLNKQSAPDKLVEAIHIVANGGKYVSESLAQKMVFELDKNIEELPHQKLAKREYEVMLMIAKGYKTNEIAKNLCLSPKTISTYKNRIFKKMNIHNATELIRYAIDYNLI